MGRLLRALVAVAVLTGRPAVADDASATTIGLLEAQDVSREFWERTNPSFAFLDAGGLADARTVAMMQSWHAKFLGRYDWTNRVVVDFGAATGLLGEWLLQKGGARHYVAIDIAGRAVTASRERLTMAGFREGGSGMFEAVQAPVELCTLSATRDEHEHPPPADTLLSTKTLQHFASIQMLVGFLRNVRHSGIDTVMLQLVEGEETSCYGTAEDYARQSGPDSIISRLGHWCRVTVEFVQRELAGGPGASLLGGGSVDGLASYVLEWTEREDFSIPAANLKPREIGQPPPQQDFTNVYLGFRRVRPKAHHGVARLQTGGGKCVVCLPKLLEESVDGGSGLAASCAIRAAQQGHHAMSRHSALVGGVISPDQRPGGADDMVQLLQRTAWPFKEKVVVLVVLPGTSAQLVQAFSSAAAAASERFPACAVRLTHPTAPLDAYHGGWAYNTLFDEAAAVAAEYVLLADLSLYDFKLHAGSSAGLGHGPGTGWRVDGVATSFAHVEWDIMCANGVYGPEGAFYDTQSLRTDQLPDTTSLYERGVHLSPHLTPFHAMAGSDADAPPVAVDACFGGIMAVRRAVVAAGRCYYEPGALTWAEAHFGFHTCMRRARASQHREDRGGQRAGTFVNPAMMVHYDSESSRETCSVVDCEPQYDEYSKGDACAVRTVPRPSPVSYCFTFDDALVNLFCVDEFRQFEIEESDAIDAARGNAGKIKSSTLTPWSGHHAHKPNWLVSQTESEVNIALKEAILAGDLHRAEDALRACELVGVSLVTDTANFCPTTCAMRFKCAYINVRGQDADYAGAPGTPLSLAVFQRNQTMLRWLLSRGASVGTAASSRSAVRPAAPLVLAAELGEAGMVLQMLSNHNTGGRQWLRKNPEGRVAAILGLIASRTTTDIKISKKIMDTIEIHHRGEVEAAGYKKHVYYKGADWAGQSEATDAEEELREMGRVKGTSCVSQPCKNGGTCSDLLENEEDDLYNLDGAELHESTSSYACKCRQGWVGLNCEEMSPEAEGLDSLRSLIGGTHKDGALDRMWGKLKQQGQRTLQTPLMAAATVGWVGGVEAMLSLGATGGLVDDHGDDAMHAALQIFKSNASPSKARLTAAAAIVSLLMQADVVPRDKDWSSVHGRSGRLALVDELSPRLRMKLVSALRKVPDSGDQRIGRGRPPKKEGAFIRRKAGYHGRKSLERSKFHDL